MANNFLVVTIVTAVFCGCSKRDLNLPQPSPMPVQEIVQIETPACNSGFTQQQTLAEVAAAAQEMHERCGYNHDEILKLARKFSAYSN